MTKVNDTDGEGKKERWWRLGDPCAGVQPKTTLPLLLDPHVGTYGKATPARKLFCKSLVAGSTVAR